MHVSRLHYTIVGYGVEFCLLHSSQQELIRVWSSGGFKRGVTIAQPCPAFQEIQKP